MVFGELVDTVPIFGSQRKSYILIGALLMATGLLILAGAAGRWLTFARPDQLYVLGAMLVVIGTVLQLDGRTNAAKLFDRLIKERDRARAAGAYASSGKGDRCGFGDQVTSIR